MTRTATHPAQQLTRADLTLTSTGSARNPDVMWARTVYHGAQEPGESSDCAIRALMTVTGSTYADAYRLIMDRTGRTPGKGTPGVGLWQLLDQGTVLGCRFERIMGGASVYARLRTGRKQLRTFLKAHPKGRFYCWMASHAFAVVDGVLVDTWHVPGGSLVFGAWKVTDAAPAATHHPAQLKALLLGGMTTTDAATACGVTVDRAQRAADQLSALGLL